MVHLTGRIEVTVIEGRGLPNLDNSIFNSNDKSDPYCIVNAQGINGSRRLGKTHTIDDCLNPRWNYKIVTDLNQDVAGLEFIVKDRDFVTSDVIGNCYINSLLFINSTKPHLTLLHLTSPEGHPAGSIRVQIQFTGSGDTNKPESKITQKMKIKKDDIKARLIDSTSKFSRYRQPEAVVLHGMLEIYIDKAVNLPNLDTSILSFKKTDVSDPFVEILVEDIRKDNWKVATSSVIENNLNPIWEEKFHINICHQVIAVKIVVKDKDVLSADVIGSILFRAEDLVNKQEINGDFELYIRGKPKKNCLLTLSLKYLTRKQLTATPEVQGCFYSMRECNNVILYQDAHCVELPSISHDLRSQYRQPRAWLDLYHAIMDARKFIYIVGWSVNTKISLLRWNGEDNRCIGKILLQKADEGVQVIVMVWDELTSTGLNKEGTMGTSDEATAEFFKDTKVTVVLASRERHSKDVSTKEKFTNFCYTHHQKCVLVDGKVEESGNKRQIVAFIGGLDLTNGRFDTPKHDLFSTLQTDHIDDFYNNVFLTKAMYGPRQPWHDIYCQIRGPATLDLMSNFRQRWDKQGSKKRNDDQDLIKQSSLKQNFSHPNRWNVQIFRSINSDSAAFNKMTGLYVKKERLFENSIQRAYVHNIRRSKHFLYIENQYFMGSSHEWLEARETKIENLIPLEITARIEEKIAKRKRYSAYIFIPMFPEGKPSDKVTQEILHWQFRTIEMMYDRIGRAIREAELDTHPQDYLLFLCLGKKEGRNPIPTPSELTGHAANAFKYQRLMIYIHSKMAIFDDEYIIVGSANINDRSLNGNRDTEIAMGAYQPEHMRNYKRLPQGEVSMFRKSLWLEHMGNQAPIRKNPSDVTCIRKVKKLAEEGLLSYIDDGEKPGVRHMLLYPLKVDQSGSVSARRDCSTFPDTTASVVGKRSGYIPTRLTS